MIKSALANTVTNTVQEGSQNSFMSFVPLILIFIIFYIFIIRPQTKKQKEQQELINSIKKGDKVIISGGIIGKITKVIDKDLIEIEIANDTNIKALKSSIISLAGDLNKKK